MKHWISCERFSVQVETEGGIIVTAPLAFKTFLGQPVANLMSWASGLGESPLRACPSCGERLTRTTRVPGVNLSPIQRHAFYYYAFTERRPVREACRLACISKQTGLALHVAIRKSIAAERRAA